jgi:RNA polymerase sigma factor (sigma-70 family)
VRREPDQRSVPAPSSATEATPGGAEAPEGVLDLLTLYEVHRERIQRYCLSLLKNPADAEDATQETFARAAPQVDRLEGDATAYLTTVARNVCYDMVRHRSRRGTRDLDSVVVIDDRIGPERHAVASELAKQLWGHLNHDERTFLAHSFAGFRYDEIAKRTGRSVPAVTVSICRARQRLRRLPGTLGAAALLPLTLPRIIERLWRRGADNAGSVASAMAALDPAMVAAVLIGAASTLSTAAYAPATPTRGATAVAPATPQVAELPAPDRASSITTPASLAVTATGSAAHTPSASTSPSRAASIAPALPGSNASPEDVQFTSISTSPNYQRDHTAYASGTDARSCPSGQVCPVLFATSDGGSTWTQRTAVGYTAGAVMIPSGYPLDPTIFVAGPQGLLASSDGGDHFNTVAQLTGPTALAPGSAPGSAQIAIVQGTVWLYHQVTGRMTAGPAIPAGVMPESAMYATPDVLLVVGQRYDVVPTPHRTPVIVRCDSTTCTTVATFGQDADIQFAPAPVAPGAALLAFSKYRVYQSKDLGASFSTLLDAGGNTVSSVGMTALGTGQMRTVVAEMSPAGVPQLSLADGATGTWISLPTTLLGAAVTSVAPFGDGRIITAVALGPQGGYGLRCLAGMTSTWQPSC